jgi:hypothetical protein
MLLSSANGRQTETGCEDILLLGVLADWKIVIQAELLIAVQASPVALHGISRVGWRIRRGAPCFSIELDNGAIGEASAFAERCRS